MQQLHWISQLGLPVAKQCPGSPGSQGCQEHSKAVEFSWNSLHHHARGHLHIEAVASDIPLSRKLAAIPCKKQISHVLDIILIRLIITI